MPAPALPQPLLFEAAEQRLAPLDALARPLWRAGLTHSQGLLEPRLQGLHSLHANLLAGHSAQPQGWQWPPPALRQPLAQALNALALQRFCQDQPQLTDTVLQSLLFHLDFIVDYQDRGASAAQAIQMAVSAFSDDWRERSGQMDELLAVFGRLPEDAKHSRWDQLRGLLRSSGWQEVLRSHRLLQQLPELATLIRELGRRHATPTPDLSAQSPLPVPDTAVAHTATQRSVRVPDMPGQTRGIQRSDRIARMLPSEAVQLGHPRLRLLWHARRAERTLLCYEDDDHLSEQRQQQSLVQQPRPGPQPAPRAVAGPLLVCVDTSGSMQGGAEAVAKAVVLEAMRSAHASGRACQVFAFGGDGEVLELELGLDSAGMARLTEFLGQGFRGGTDICGPLERVLAKLEDSRWQRADLLIASDGEFGATPQVAARLEAVKQALGLRVQGVLIGDRETLGLLEVCDRIYPVRDWRRFGGQQVESPVHTPALTALYFPGALRNAENRAATVSGAALGAAVRAGLLRGTPGTPDTRGDNETG
ncbi:MAG: VWA domain-containing protein [Rhodoferax sp.]|nr:VWA domain-containing protein [Rhodoferax sp.]